MKDRIRKVFKFGLVREGPFSISREKRDIFPEISSIDSTLNFIRQVFQDFSVGMRLILK